MIEWANAATLRTAQGDLDLNTAVSPGTPRYLIDQSRSRATRGLRVTSDPVPQGDGEIFHRRFTDGTELELAVQLWHGDQPACGADARLMYEALSLHLSAMLNEPGRFLWLPTDYGDERMLDQARWLSPLRIEYGENALQTVTFAIDSPFPYMIDSTQLSQTIEHLDTDIIVNEGNADFYAVIKAHGDAALFSIENLTTGLQIFYDWTRPGAVPIDLGDYAEIDTFRNTVYRNGDEASLKAGIDVELTDFFPLVPGENEIAVDGVDAEFLVNHAWLP